MPWGHLNWHDQTTICGDWYSFISNSIQNRNRRTVRLGFLFASNVVPKAESKCDAWSAIGAIRNFNYLFSFNFIHFIARASTAHEVSLFKNVDATVRLDWCIPRLGYANERWSGFGGVDNMAEP